MATFQLLCLLKIGYFTRYLKWCFVTFIIADGGTCLLSFCIWSHFSCELLKQNISTNCYYSVSMTVWQNMHFLLLFLSRSWKHSTNMDNNGWQADSLSNISSFEITISLRVKFINSCYQLTIINLSDLFPQCCLPSGHHYSDDTWVSLRLKSPSTRRFVQHVFQTNTKETSKLCITGPLWGESTGYRWIPLTKGQ